MNTQDVAVIIVAAGSATRFGAPKQRLPLNGLPVFLHSVKAFIGLCAELIVITPTGETALYRQLAAEHGFGDACNTEHLRFVEGGSTRQQSVQNGLAAVTLTTGIVAIHDAARPYVSTELLATLIDAARLYGGAAPAVPMTDTVLHADDSQCMDGVVPREHLWRVATPQVFRIDALCDAYAHADGTSHTDDTQVFFHAGYRVKLLQAPANELAKITYPQDLAAAQKMEPSDSTK